MSQKIEEGEQTWMENIFCAFTAAIFSFSFWIRLKNKNHSDYIMYLFQNKQQISCFLVIYLRAYLNEDKVYNYYLKM